MEWKYHIYWIAPNTLKNMLGFATDMVIGIRYIALILLLMTGGCGNVTIESQNGSCLDQRIYATNSDDALAIVDGSPITVEQYLLAIKKLPETLKLGLKEPSQRVKILDQLINRRLLFNEALKHEELFSPQFRARMIEVLEREVATEFMHQTMQAHTKKSVSDIEVQQYYEQHNNEFRVPPRVKVGRIFVSSTPKGQRKTPARLLKAIEALRKGDLFDTVSKRYGEGPEVLRHGIMGWFTKGGTKSDFVRIAWELQNIGDFSEIHTENDGSYIVVLLDRIEESLTPIDEVRETIKSRIAQQHEYRAIREVTADLREKAVIERADHQLNKISGYAGTQTEAAATPGK